MIRSLGLWLIGALLACGAVQANTAIDLAEDPVVEQRLIGISEELRCLVCQNESLAGSRADLANDLRREIRTLIKDGRTDAEIMDFMVSRYGDFVRYRPPVKPLTWALWFGPATLLLLAGWGLWRMVRNHRRNVIVSPPLTPEQQARAQALLNDNKDPS
ncbi:cytochrome c-type biogenesis protein [Curvibacter sp. APW13]|uniref:cytochrome c-type biogenesis protein n=1 Tax=Curvibacter sp. APW13 TaxID=3077236 RepID=UPI0028DEF0FD|nr:cytochrome c-type biogenesis protein [Curvibacter sp. APW13]MDT8991882.1 cytochrome c-type biogenesis protein [Curvibacter sp. APW13]